jgi:hypothetical protein
VFVGAAPSAVALLDAGAGNSGKQIVDMQDLPGSVLAGPARVKRRTSLASGHCVGNSGGKDRVTNYAI